MRVVCSSELGAKPKRGDDRKLSITGLLGTSSTDAARLIR